MKDPSSLEVFKGFCKTTAEGNLDASEVLSTKCYQAWLHTRRRNLKFPEEAFRNTLMGHVKGFDGRKPFSKEEEAALLNELRNNRIWPCFEGTDCQIGLHGIRAKGYHERLTEKEDFSGHMSSYEVFMKYANMQDNYGNSKILSIQCYQNWLKSRSRKANMRELAFRKALIAHVTGKDRLRPFPPDTEKKILCELRKEQPWPCFFNSPLPNVRNIGSQGSRHIGYHEKQYGSGFIGLQQSGQKRKRENNNSGVKSPALRAKEKFYANEEYLTAKTTVLSEFKGVENYEIDSVLELKEACAPIFIEHYGKKAKYPISVVGDVRLLRMVRRWRYNITRCISETHAFLKWRTKYKVDEMAKKFIDKNLSYASVRDERNMLNYGVYFPFIAEHEKGHIIDYYRLPSSPLDTKFDTFSNEDRFIARIELAEYRYLVMDSLSIRKKKLILFIALYDWRFIGSAYFYTAAQSFSFFSFLDSCSYKHSSHIRNIIEMHKRYYAGPIKKLYIIGNGFIFSTFASLISTLFIGPALRVEFVTSVDSLEKLFVDMFGKQEKWPEFLTEVGLIPSETELTVKRIGDF